jgi:hypothetical protein
VNNETSSNGVHTLKTYVLEILQNQAVKFLEFNYRGFSCVSKQGPCRLKFRMEINGQYVI